MEVVNFCNSKFWQIPKQDNPAFDKHECYMIVQDENPNFTNVLHIEPVIDPLSEESVTRICKCWDSNKALEIAELLANNR